MDQTYMSQWEPSSPMLDKLAGALRSGRSWLNKAKVPDAVPLMGGQGAGDMLMGKWPEGISRIAYDEPLTTGSGQTTHIHPDMEDIATAPLNFLSPGGSAGKQASAVAGKSLSKAMRGGATVAAKEAAGDVSSSIAQPQSAERLVQALREKSAPAIWTPNQGSDTPLLPRGSGMYTPDVPQVDLARQRGRGNKYNPRMQDLLDSRSARGKVDELIGKGDDLGMREWYGTEPLRQAAMDHGLSQSEFERFMAHMASASQRNPVDQQNKMGSYMWMLDRQGGLDDSTRLLTNKLRKQGDTSGSMVEFPKGLGSLAQGDIFDRSKQIAMGTDINQVLPEDRKLGTFYRNLLGNLRPVTVDVNAVRGPILAGKNPDPRWLVSQLLEKEFDENTGKAITTGKFRPRDDVASGKLSLADARNRPGFWTAAPEGSDYAGFEDLWQRAAKRHGIAPAEAQALGWYGSADVTALKTKPELYVDNLERLIRSRSDQLGIRPTEMLSKLLRGEDFLRFNKQGQQAGPKIRAPRSGAPQHEEEQQQQ